jgi:probable addiction module antidote protein
MKKKKIPTYHEDLIRDLKNPEFARLYLAEALKDQDKKVFLLALRDLIVAYGGITKFSKLTGISREHLYRMLSEKGNPEFSTLQKLLAAFNLQFSISPKTQRAA